MAGHDGFTVTPRRGELIVFDKLSRPARQPRAAAGAHRDDQGRPRRADGVRQRHARARPRSTSSARTTPSSTAEGIAHLQSLGRRIMPALLGQEVTAVYVGCGRPPSTPTTRSGSTASAVRVGGGIRSTGLTGSMAIAEHLRDELDAAGLDAPRAPARASPAAHAVHRRGVRRAPTRSRSGSPPDPEYGRIVCFCERVTRGEIRDAAASPIPPRRPRRAAAAHPGADGPLPGLLLRRARPGGARGGRRSGPLDELMERPR